MEEYNFIANIFVGEHTKNFYLTKNTLFLLEKPTSVCGVRKISLL